MKNLTLKDDECGLEDHFTITACFRSECNHPTQQCFVKQKKEPVAAGSLKSINQLSILNQCKSMTKNEIYDALCQFVELDEKSKELTGQIEDLESERYRVGNKKGEIRSLLFNKPLDISLPVLFSKNGIDYYALKYGSELFVEKVKVLEKEVENE